MWIFIIESMQFVSQYIVNDVICYRLIWNNHRYDTSWFSDWTQCGMVQCDLMQKENYIIEFRVVQRVHSLSLFLLFALQLTMGQLPKIKAVVVLNRRWMQFKFVQTAVKMNKLLISRACFTLWTGATTKELSPKLLIFYKLLQKHKKHRYTLHLSPNAKWTTEINSPCFIINISPKWCSFMFFLKEYQLMHMIRSTDLLVLLSSWGNSQTSDPRLLSFQEGHHLLSRKKWGVGGIICVKKNKTKKRAVNTTKPDTQC